MSKHTYIDGRVFDPAIYKRVLRLVMPYRAPFYWAAMLAVVLALLAPARPWLIQLTVDDYILRHDYTGLLWMTVLMGGLLLFEAGSRYIFIYLTNWLGQSVTRDLRARVFKHIIGLKLRFFDRTPIGTLTTRTINDVEAVNRIFSEGLIRIIGDLLTLVTVIAMMLVMDWRLAMISLLTLPLMVLATYVFQDRVKDAFQDVRTQVARLNAFLQEHITGMHIVQVFTREREEMSKFEKINASHRDANLRAVWYYSIFFPVVELILATSIGILVWWGGHRVLADQTSLGMLIAFILYLHMLFRPIRLLADKFNTLQMGIVASERIFHVLDTKDRIEDSGDQAPAHIRGDIRFENVWFAYEKEAWVLRDLDLHIPAGQTLAIVGATGAGKTSIINILCRFYEIDKGRITIDDRDIRNYELQTLRAHLGVVLQDVFLFSGSIAGNVSLHNPRISESEIKAAAREIGADRFIENLDAGLAHDVRERGSSLSLGQRQLIAFLRALVYDPAVLILDEATAAVDTESERLIQRATEKLVKDRTSIIIAHRLSTIRHANQILVLEHGRIIEKGTHDTLMEKDGYYRKLYMSQFKAAQPGHV